MAASLGPLRHAAAAQPLTVVVQDAGNLQFLSFWTALGAGYFADEGLAVKVVTPPTPREVTNMFQADQAQVAVLCPPVYLPLIADGFPLRLIANLLENDPVNLVVRKSILRERHISADQPLAKKLAGLRGLRIGVAGGPLTRLRELFRAAGLNADETVRIVITGKDQNDLFAKNEIDGIYCHTPHLEEALVRQGAEILVNQSRGEVPVLATRQIHALVATQRFVEEEPQTLVKLSRALMRANDLIRGDAPAAVKAVMRALPGRDPKLVWRLVKIYGPAVPRGAPLVTVEGLKAALALFPARRTPPDLSKVDLTRFIDNRFVDEARRGRPAAPLPK